MAHAAGLQVEGGRERRVGVERREDETKFHGFARGDDGPADLLSSGLRAPRRKRFFVYSKRGSCAKRATII